MLVQVTEESEERQDEEKQDATCMFIPETMEID